MTPTVRTFTVLGAFAAMLAVALGAFGTHALRPRLAPDMLAVYQTATQYHFYHALGLLLVALLIAQFPTAGALRAAGWLMVAGIVLFSGSLYALSLTGARWLGAITPLGGVAFITAWAMVAICTLWRG